MTSSSLSRNQKNRISPKDRCCLTSLFRGSSQARTGELKKEFELSELKELKDRIQTIVIWVLTQGK